MAAVKVVIGDLTRLEVDVVVNAANEQLAHGGGVAAALARAGAPFVDEDSARWIAEHGPIGPGVAAVTGAGGMPSQWVVHVVGPRHRPGQDNAGLLAQAVTAALDAGRELGATSIAMPAISAGIFGYPLAEATAVIARAARSWADDQPGTVAEILLVGRDEHAADAFRAALDDT